MIWTKINGSKVFDVSNDGKVRNRKTGTIVKHTIAKNGLHRVTLTEDGKSRTCYVHDLVADAYFVGDKENREIKYRDGDYSNISVGNLIVNKKSKTLIGVRETGQIFESRARCCAIMGIGSSQLSMCLNHPDRSYKGYHYDLIEVEN